MTEVRQQTVIMGRQVTVRHETRLSPESVVADCFVRNNNTDLPLDSSTIRSTHLGAQTGNSAACKQIYAARMSKLTDRKEDRGETPWNPRPVIVFPGGMTLLGRRKLMPSAT